VAVTRDSGENIDNYNLSASINPPLPETVSPIYQWYKDDIEFEDEGNLPNRVINGVTEISGSAHYICIIEDNNGEYYGEDGVTL